MSLAKFNNTGSVMDTDKFQTLGQVGMISVRHNKAESATLTVSSYTLTQPIYNFVSS